MSILQISRNQNASSRLHSMLTAKPADVEWPNYAQALDQVDHEQEDLGEIILNKKRAMAHKFLRVIRDSNFYRKDESCVFTPEFVQDLGSANAARRHRSNPWLQSGVNESMEDGQVTERVNVLPFGPQIVAQNKTTAFPS